MSILEEYMKEVNLYNNSQGDEKIDDYNFSEAEKEQFLKEIRRIKESPDDIVNKFHNDYKNISENEMDTRDLTAVSEAKVFVKRAYCPNCGRELVCVHPLLSNPYNGEKIAKHECSCGFKANLEYAYPRIVFKDKDNNEIIAFIN